ncbi:MAG: acyltransferase, partial [Gammaproteobacteria bacterium]|nr:acyltransferase [Gammaproteobacteria bacterium]
MKAGYRPDVDGLRAVAVLAVILFHAGYGCPGGFVGVDVFFVISGYLITRLIFAELDSGSFSLAGFWERRIRRILPILTVVIAVTLALGAIHLWPDDFDGLADSALAMSLMVSNLYFWQDTGYFTGPAEY